MNLKTIQSLLNSSLDEDIRLGTMLLAKYVISYGTLALDLWRSSEMTEGAHKIENLKACGYGKHIIYYTDRFCVNIGGDTLIYSPCNSEHYRVMTEGDVFKDSRTKLEL